VKDFSENAPAKTKIVISTPKSEKGIRTIPMVNEVIKLLKTHKRQQAEHILSLGGIYEDQGYVFTNDFGKHLEPRYFSTAFEDVKKSTGIQDLTIHSLRHTFATRALESDVDMKELQEILGHADYSVTANIYTHVSNDIKAKAMAKVSSTIAEIGSGK